MSNRKTSKLTVLERRCYSAMKNRCYNPKNNMYHRYGGRGIKICDRWLQGFDFFFEDMGNKPTPKHSIDRINNDGDYCPENCRWITNKEQCRNNSINVLIETEWGLITCIEASERSGIDSGTISYRYKRGLRAITSKRPQKRH